MKEKTRFLFAAAAGALLLMLHGFSLYLSTGFTFNSDTVQGFAKWVGGNYADTCDVITTGIAENTKENTINVFPNPASDNITFQFDESNPTGEILVTDNLGREILRKEIAGEQRVEFSVADLAEGMYFYRVVEKGAIEASGKFIVQ